VPDAPESAVASERGDEKGTTLPLAVRGVPRERCGPPLRPRLDGLGMSAEPEDPKAYSDARRRS